MVSPEKGWMPFRLRRAAVACSCSILLRTWINAITSAKPIKLNRINPKFILDSEKERQIRPCEQICGGTRIDGYRAIKGNCLATNGSPLNPNGYSRRRRKRWQAPTRPLGSG